MNKVKRSIVMKVLDRTTNTYVPIQSFLTRVPEDVELFSFHHQSTEEGYRFKQVTFRTIKEHLGKYRPQYSKINPKIYKMGVYAERENRIILCNLCGQEAVLSTNCVGDVHHFYLTEDIGNDVESVRDDEFIVYWDKYVSHDTQDPILKQLLTFYRDWIKWFILGD